MPIERQQMHDTLEQLKKCRGRGCTIPRHGMINEATMFNTQVQHQSRGLKRKYDSIGKGTGKWNFCFSIFFN